MEKYLVLLGAPSGGTSLDDSCRARWLASMKHDVSVLPSQCSGGNHDRLWANALNAGRAGKCTHFAMLHGDIVPQGDPQPRWLDVLLDEMDRLDADLISAVVAIKDSRGVCSCGLGSPENWWVPYKRLTIRELPSLPQTFGLKELGHPDKYLLHNNGCWVADMRKPLWYKTNAEGDAPVYFQFNERVRLIDGEFKYLGESEDWMFSRLLHEAGAKTYLTQAVKTLHMGSIPFPNSGTWGDYKDGDNDTRPFWGTTGNAAS